MSVGWGGIMEDTQEGTREQQGEKKDERKRESQGRSRTPGRDTAFRQNTLRASLQPSYKDRHPREW